MTNSNYPFKNIEVPSALEMTECLGEITGRLNGLHRITGKPGETANLQVKWHSDDISTDIDSVVANLTLPGQAIVGIICYVDPSAAPDSSYLDLVTNDSENFPVVHHLGYEEVDELFIPALELLQNTIIPPRN